MLGGGIGEVEAAIVDSRKKQLEVALVSGHYFELRKLG